MGKSVETFRFAFGSADSPASAVWRVNVHKKHGDVYLHNAPQVGSTIHIALHASGRFSLKLGDERFKLEPPYKDPYGIFWGPIIFFRPFDRELPPTRPTGSLELIKWLGLPSTDHLFVVKFLYTPISMQLTAESDETLLAGPFNCKLFHQEMRLHLFIQHRQLMPGEKLVSRREKLDFSGSQPLALEMIRISKTEMGPSAIIHEPYELQKKNGVALSEPNRG